MSIVPTGNVATRSREIWKLMCVVLIAVFVNDSFGTNALFIISGVVTISIVAFFRRNVAEYTIYALVLWFAAGYRAIGPYGGGYKIHMLDILPILIVFLWLRDDIPRERLHPAFRQRIRFLIISVVVVSIYGMYFALINDVPTPRAVMSMKNFLIVVPLLLFVPYILQGARVTTRLMWMLLVTGLIVAIPGILEYNLGIFATGSSYSDAFDRALFTFWGATMAVLVLTLCFQSHWYLWGEAGTVKMKVVILVSAFIQLYAIYISGTRSMWIAILLMTAFAIYLRLGLWKAVLTVPLFIALVAFVPDSGVKRMESFYFLHETDQYGRADTRWLDSSGADRAARMEGAIDAMISHPLGGGWSSSGWVHSDVLSIGADLGIIPGLIFVFILLSTTVKVILQARRSKGSEQWRWLTYSGFMITNVMLFSFGGVTWLIQYAMPVWFTWLLTENHVHNNIPNAKS